MFPLINSAKVMFLIPLCVVVTHAEEHDRSYTPSHHVEEAHELPHLGWDLHRKSNTFDMTTDMEPNSYAHSLIVLPTIIFVIVAALVVLFQLALITRALAHMFCCCSKYLINMVYKCLHKTKRCKRKYVNQKSQKRRAKVFFVIFLLASVISASVVFDGDSRVNAGVRDIQNSFEFISAIAGNIGVSLDVMSEDAETVGTYLEKSACPKRVEKYMKEVAVYLDEFNAAVGSAEKVTSSVPTGIDITNRYLDEYAVKKKGLVVACFFCGVVILATLYGLAAACKNAFLLRLCVVATEVIVIGLALLGCVQMVIVMGLSDFCYSPAENVITMTPSGAISSVVKYYTVCEGEDPLEQPLKEAEYWAGRINATLSDIKEYAYVGQKCQSQTKEALVAVGDMFEQVIVILEYAKCPYLHRVWSGVVERGFCDEVFSGVYVMWIAYWTVLACLFVLMVLTALIYPSYRGRFFSTICCCLHKPRRFWRRLCRCFLRPAASLTKKRPHSDIQNPAVLDDLDKETKGDPLKNHGESACTEVMVLRDVEMVKLGADVEQGSYGDAGDPTDAGADLLGGVTSGASAALGGLWRWGGRLRSSAEWINIMEDSGSDTDWLTDESSICSSTWSGVSDYAETDGEGIPVDSLCSLSLEGKDDDSKGDLCAREMQCGRYDGIEEVVSILHSLSTEDDDERRVDESLAEEGEGGTVGAATESAYLHLSQLEEGDIEGEGWDDEGDDGVAVMNELHAHSPRSSSRTVERATSLPSPVSRVEVNIPDSLG